jgi:hypothetical protein
MAHVGPFTWAPYFYYGDAIAIFGLGLSSMEPKHNETYWMEIWQELRTALESYSNRGHELGRVIVYGEFAENGIFETILREEVEVTQWSSGEGKEIH